MIAADGDRVMGSFVAENARCDRSLGDAHSAVAPDHEALLKPRGTRGFAGGFGNASASFAPESDSFSQAVAATHAAKMLSEAIRSRISPRLRETLTLRSMLHVGGAGAGPMQRCHALRETCSNISAYCHQPDASL